MRFCLKHIYSICLLTAILLLLPRLLSAQNDDLRFENLSVVDGLSHNSALCLLQDSHGFLWIGTQNGLNRYDGYFFKKYFHNPADSTSLSDSYINSIFQDSRGTIWVGTNKGGLNRYDRIRDCFTNYQYHPDDPHSLGMGSVYAITEDGTGNLWVGVNPSGLFLLNRDNDSFQQIPYEPQTPDGFHNHSVYTLYTDHRGGLWIGGDEGLSNLIGIDLSVEGQLEGKDSLARQQPLRGLEKSRFRFRNWSHQRGHRNSLVSDGVHCIVEQSAAKGRVFWVGAWGGLSRMNIDEQNRVRFTNFHHDSTNPYSISGNRIWSLGVDLEGNLWAGTYGKGINRFDPKTGRFHYYSNSSADPHDVSGYSVRSIMEDKSGVLWIGTESQGLKRLLPANKRFQFYRHHINDPRSLSNNDVSAIWEDASGALWVGTKHGGLNLLDSTSQTTGHFFHFRHDPKNPHSILHDRIRAIYRDRLGVLWVASWDPQGGLNQFDPATGGFRHFQHDPADPSSLADNQVRTIAEDSLGNLWVGLEAGLDRFDRENQRFIHYRNDPFDPSSISDNTVIHLYTDHRGVLWISTFNYGLNSLKPGSSKFTRYLPDLSDPYSISHNRIWSVYEDHQGRLWVGTDGGLNLFDRSSQHFFHFTEEDGLCNNTVYRILEDGWGNLWVSTQNGLAKCELAPPDAAVPDKIHFVNFDQNDGLPGNEFNNVSLRSRSGELFFGGVDGLLHFNPDSIRENRRPPPVVFTSFKIFEKDIALDSAITEKKKINLSYQDNFFSLEFAALDFREPQKNLYAYKLEGFNKDWIFAGNRRYVSFSHLSPGDYNFRVKATNNKGFWNEQGAAIKIIIAPPFWMTSWFRWSFGTVLLVGLIMVVRFVSTQKLKKQLRNLEIRQRLQEERERISSELHDNIGSNLANLANGLEISRLYMKEERLFELNDYLANLEKHTRTTIGELRETIWFLNEKITTSGALVKQVQKLVSKCSHLQLAPRLSWRFEGSKEMSLTPVQSLNLYRICQEALNNSLKHAQAKGISIFLEAIEGKKVNLKIIDDGVGMECTQSNDSEGYGLANMKRRAERINAALSIESSPGNGTKVEILLPLG